ncbi:hypothetical protein [Streptococcus pneumoniae]|uniref:hypothetical protein n=1 Tax=Streptococcus pneumoniae TaxID=1313 RepID=UPI0011561BAD|nr:hypothetical protein [Streptococcus pneumoniae]
MKIKEQTRKLVTGCSKHRFEVECFEVADELTKSDQNTVLRLWIELTKSVILHTARVKLTWFEESFEEYK